MSYEKLKEDMRVAYKKMALAKTALLKRDFEVCGVLLEAVVHEAEELSEGVFDFKAMEDRS